VPPRRPRLVPLLAVLWLGLGLGGGCTFDRGVDEVPWSEGDEPREIDADGPRVELDVLVTDIDVAESPIEFTVRVVNLWDEALAWPDPCPTYVMELWEGAEVLDEERRSLNCDGLDALAPGAAVDFAMRLDTDAAERGTRIEWAFDDPRFFGWAVAGVGSGGAVQEEE
jgi:hypothetical protein